MRSAATPSDSPVSLTRSAGATFFINGAGAAVMLVLILVLARWLGAAGLGAYQFAWAWIDVLTIIVLLGFDKLLVRMVGVYEHDGAWTKLKGLLRSTDIAVAAAAVGVAVLAAVVAVAAKDLIHPLFLSSLLVAFAILPWRAAVMLRRGALLGLRKVLPGQVANVLIQPAVTLALVAGVWWFWRGGLTSTVAMICSGLAVVVAVIVSHILLRRALPRELRDASPQFEMRTWFRTAFPMLVVASLALINARIDTIMVGLIEGAEAAGVYSVASRAAELTRFGAMAVNPAIAASLARLHHRGDHVELQRLFTRGTHLLLGSALLVAGGLALLGLPLLALFGSEFHAGYVPLLILAGGYVLMAFAGDVETLLLMSGHERRTAWAFVVAAVLNLVLNAIMIPLFGLNGAAAATATAAVVWAAMLSVAVWRRLGVMPGPWRPAAVQTPEESNPS